MKIKPIYVFAVLRNIWLKLRFGRRLSLNVFGVFIHPSTRVEISGDGHLVFQRGRRIYIDRGGLIRASGGAIEIGAGAFMNQNCMVVSHAKISIGAEAMFGPGVCVFDSDHALSLDGRPFSAQGYTFASVELEENVWLGANTVVTKGCRIGKNSVVAANSVARGSLDAASVYAGAPARKVKSLLN